MVVAWAVFQWTSRSAVTLTVISSILRSHAEAGIVAVVRELSIARVSAYLAVLSVVVRSLITLLIALLVSLFVGLFVPVAVVISTVGMVVSRAIAQGAASS